VAVRRDKYAPRYEIIINRTRKVTEEVTKFISEVRVEDDADLFDKISLKINTLNATRTGVVQDLLDSRLFGPGNLIQIKMGYGNALVTVGAGLIVKTNPNFNTDGPTLEIIAYDPFFNMSQRKITPKTVGFVTEGGPGSFIDDTAATPKRKGRSFKGFRDSQVATIIAADHGFDFSQIKRASGIFNRFQLLGKNDYEFLKRIADVRGFDLYNKFDPKTGKFQIFFEPPTDRQKEIFTFEYFEGNLEDSTLLSFTPTLNTAEQATQFEIVGWDRKKKKKISTFFKPGELISDNTKLEGKNQDKPLPKNKDGRTIRFKAFGNNIEIIRSKPFKDESEAKLFIEQWIRKRLEHFITGSGKVVGLEVLQSRQTHNLTGLGNLLNGKYFFTGVIHVMTRDNQYATEFTARKVVEGIT